MPELPDIEAYLRALRPRTLGETVVGVRLSGVSLLKSFDPPLSDAEGRSVLGLERLGKRVVFELTDDHFLVFHLMVAGRLRWAARGARIPGKIGQAAVDFTSGTLLVTEAGTKRRASLHFVASRKALRDLDPGGAEVLDVGLAEFSTVLSGARHTLKRALTDPTLFAGIGGAYSDEIMHRARLSPLALADRLSEEQLARLWEAARAILSEWSERLGKEADAAFPEKVTAFRPEMAVHGKFGDACPVCGAPVQRIVYASNETNYCPGCQTGGKILADRALSRLLKADWPSDLDEL